LPWLAATMVCIALAGCTPTRSVPPQASGSELQQLVDDERALFRQWYLYLVNAPPDPPVIPVERVIAPSETQAVYGSCMDAAGYPNYGEPGATVAVEQSTDGQLALYICVSQFPVEPSAFGIFSRDQLDYLYDYYQQSLIPCLAASGHDVIDIPVRAEFLRRDPAQLYAWSPYGELTGLSPKLLTSLAERCPEFPPGIFED
jgi:hypothetical protein